MANTDSTMKADMSPWGAALYRAACLVDDSKGDWLVVLPVGYENAVPGTQHDDGISAVAAIDVIRMLVENYENEQNYGEDG
jgi:hypothetical protein